MTRSLLALAVIVCITFSAHARPAYKQALAQYFGVHLPKSLNACTTCHLPDAKDRKDDADKPHNVFGLRLKTVKEELRKAGKATSIDARLDAILEEDSDGDGVSNLLEILTGHSPGDRNDRPSDKELADVQIKLIAFQRDRKGYRWRPFEVVKRPAVPTVKNAGWVRNPIDAFVAAEHEAFGVKPRREAERAVLLRRVYLDLIGLPPTPAELHAFLKDTAPDAYDKLVDDLLKRPQYGERWGRHWMDVWRYSDWAGYGAQVRDSQPYIWHWRDWIIDSLNDDKGYDRMVMEMLAGDELAPSDPKALAATGYLVRNFKLLSREKWLQDTVEHTFQAFQGVTIGCAKCHDHMFDPILQTDYYQVRAIFEPHHVRTDSWPGEPDLKKNGLVRAYDKDLAAPTYLFLRGDDRTPDKNKKIVPGVPEVLGGRLPKVEEKEVTKYLKMADFDLFRDLTSVTIAIPGGRNPEEGVVVLEGNFDADKIETAVSEATKAGGSEVKVKTTKIANIKAYEVKGKDEKTMYIGILSKKTMIAAATKADFAEAVARSGGSKAGTFKSDSFKGLLETVNSKQSISVVATSKIMSKLAENNPNAGNDQAKMAIAALQQLDGFSAAVTIQKNIDFQIGINTKDAETAQKYGAAVNLGIGVAKAKVAEQAKQNEKLAPLVDVVNSIRASSKGPNLVVTGQITFETLAELLKNIPQP